MLPNTQVTTMARQQTVEDLEGFCPFHIQSAVPKSSWNRAASRLRIRGGIHTERRQKGRSLLHAGELPLRRADAPRGRREGRAAILHRGVQAAPNLGGDHDLGRYKRD